MAHIYRYLIALLYIAIFFAAQCFTQAHAETIPATPTGNSIPQFSAGYSSPQDTSIQMSTGCGSASATHSALAAAWPKINHFGTVRSVLNSASTNGTSTTYNYSNYDISNGGLLSTDVATATYSTCPSKPEYSCPSTYTLSESTCTRNDCYQNADAYKGQGYYYNSASGPSSALCIGGCFVSTGVVGACAGNNCFAYAGSKNGSNCSGQPTATFYNPSSTPPPPTPYDCASKGQSYGTVNGTTVCVPPSTPGAAPTTSQTSTTATNTTSSGTSTISTTTKDTVDSDGSISRTTTTTTTPSGGGTPTTTSASMTTSASTFCEQNPSAQVCKNSTSFTGDCSSGFACSGDASTCAIAKEQYKRNCTYDNDLAQAKSDLSTKQAYTDGDKITRGQNATDVQNFLNGTGTTTVNLPSSLSENGNYAFSSSGFQDFTVTAMGRSVTMPISRVNPYFGYMGNILLALAYLAAFRIVLGNGRDD